MTIARHVSIRGRVQGVFFRAWTVETARSLDVVGWVRNRRNGTVEAFVQGEPAAVERMIDAAHKGPPNARVDRVGVDEAEIDRVLKGFSQQRTA